MASKKSLLHMLFVGSLNEQGPVEQELNRLRSKKQQHFPLLSSSLNKKKLWTERMIVGKSVWEWLSLLLVPLLIGLGTIWVTNQQTTLQNALSEQQYRNDQDIAQQARWDDILKAYRDGIDTLVLTDGLRTSHEGDDVQRVAHSRTLDVLRQVDQSRKGAVIAYLGDLGLIQGGYRDNKGIWYEEKSIISLDGVDLRGVDLRGANLVSVDLSSFSQVGRTILPVFVGIVVDDLVGADLRRANLSRADLSGVDLSRADLSGANLNGADLRGAHLLGADLFGADLRGADLRGADLREADLREADLIEADLREADLRGANQLVLAHLSSDTVLPDGSRYPSKSWPIP